MKKNRQLRWVVIGFALALGASLSHAHGPSHYRGHSGGGGWVGPVLFGTAVMGTAIYMSRPVQPSPVVIVPPPAVVVTTPAPVNWVGVVPQPVESYYCRDSGQYFPTVQTCPTPWMVVLR
jgi:hypothetical protein